MGGSLPPLDRPAPELALVDAHGAPLTSADLRGAPVLLVFVPFAFSRTCTGELGEMHDGLGELEVAGVRPVAVSCDPMTALRAWGEQEGYSFDLASDFWPHGAAARAYGVFDTERGHAQRGSFLIDASGVLRWALVHTDGRARPWSAYRAAIAGLADADRAPLG